MLAIVLGATTLLTSEKVNAMVADNVTVNFEEPILYEIVLKELNKKSNIVVISNDDNNKSIVLSQEDINLVRYLELSYYDSETDEVVSNLSGIEKFTELLTLSIHNTSINTGVAPAGALSDFSPLKELTKLKGLSLTGCFESDLSLITCDLESESLEHISKLTNLETLYLGGLNFEGNKLTDITELKKLVNLKDLRLSNNQITDITPLKDLTNLRKLDLRCNQITDISPLENLTNIYNLVLGRGGYAGNREGLPIEGNIDVLENLTNLSTVKLSNCGLTDLSALSNLNKLGSLDLSYNNITDISPLSNLNNIDLIYNSIMDFSPLANKNIPNIEKNIRTIYIQQKLAIHLIYHKYF